ncbi:MAG: patatin-like phospholipase family protein [Candidatus Limnocylindrales bacterium]
MATRAIVLAGGGLTGIGWELGVLLGMQTGGIDVTAWDRIVGTSAGSVVGASLGSADGLSRLTSNLGAVEPGALSAHEDSVDRELLARIRELWYDTADAATGPDQVVRAEIGRLASAYLPEREAEFVGVLERVLPTTEWPAALMTTAVDASDGAFRTFDADSGVPLAAAVAASCAVPGVFPPVTVAGRRYIDGGVGSASNALLAAGRDLIVVVAPVWPDTPPEHRYFQEIAALRAAGSRVVEVVLDEAAAGIFDSDLIDVEEASQAGMVGFPLGVRAAQEIAAA